MFESLSAWIQTKQLVRYSYFCGFSNHAVCLWVLFFLTSSVTETRFIVVHELKNEDGIKSFFQEVYEVFIKVSITLQQFDRSTT